MNIRNEKQPTWQHDHTFGQDRRKRGESRTFVVVLLTAVTMIIEITAGIVYGSMALLADGLHMASHASALTIALIAYIYARRNAHNDRFCFGTGKVNSLAGFTGAVLLALFALVMAWESFHRIVEPVPIAFNQALVVAFFGLLVNGVSVVVLDCSHSHQNDDQHEEADEPSASQDRGGREHDHNLRSAYLHVLADALTSLLAIAALLAGKYLGLNWLDPIMGIVGAILVARWSFGLLASASAVLLDHRAPATIENTIRQSLETAGDRVTDLHVWSVGPGVYCVVISVVTENPQPPKHYKSLLPKDMGLEHVTIEIHNMERPPPSAQIRSDLYMTERPCE
jgi:cation diffusion facilitator family transporter